MDWPKVCRDVYPLSLCLVVNACHMTPLYKFIPSDYIKFDSHCGEEFYAFRFLITFFVLQSINSEKKTLNISLVIASINEVALWRFWCM